MTKSISLVYISSEVIKGFCSNHPIDWGDRRLANGPGNLLTPCPAVEVFFRLLAQTGELFTQEDYVSFAWQTWDGWQGKLTKAQIEGMRHRLYRNFYPSAIDSMHVWSLLVETGEFDRCILDTAEDSVGKTDISVWPKLGQESVKIALHAGNAYSRKWTRYKRANRGDVVSGTIDITLSMDRPKMPGNKRWYNLDDLAPVLRKLEQLKLWH